MPISPEVLNVAIDEIGLQISEKFTLQMLSAAMKMGVYGEFGEYKTISAAVIKLWVFKFRQTRQYDRMASDFSIKTPINRPSDEELEKMKLQNIKDQYAAFIDGRPFVDGGNVTFRFLRDNGYIPEDLSRYDEQARLFAETMNQRHRRVKSVGEYVEMIQRTAENRRNYLAICEAFRGIQLLGGIEIIES